MKKKLLAVLLSAAVAIPLAACSAESGEEQEGAASESGTEQEKVADETADKSSDDDNKEVIDSFEYEYDSNNKISVYIDKDTETGELGVTALGHYEDGNSGLMLADFAWVFSYVTNGGENPDLGYGGTVGGEAYVFVMADNVVALNTIPTDKDEIDDVPDKYSTEQMKAVYDGIIDLYVRNGIKEKSYNTLVYEDEKVKIYFTGADGDGVNFSVENSNDYTITIQAETLAINGISTNSIIMSDEVAAQSTGAVKANCSDFAGVEEFETITGELRIIDDDWNSYDANFVNVEIE